LETILARWLTPPTNDPAAANALAAADAALAEASEGALNMQFLEQFQELDPSGGLIRNIMQIFLDSAGDALRQIEQAVAAGDADGLRRLAHTLKSSSGNVGAETLSGVFRKLEALAKEGRLEEAKPLLGVMRQAYEHAARDIRALLAGT
jgi:two-component system sensor histidine kinase/response regulator